MYSCDYLCQCVENAKPWTFWDLMVSTTTITEGNSNWNWLAGKTIGQRVWSSLSFSLTTLRGEFKWIVNYLFQLVVYMRNGEMWITKKLQEYLKGLMSVLDVMLILKMNDIWTACNIFLSDHVTPLVQDLVMLVCKAATWSVGQCRKPSSISHVIHFGSAGSSGAPGYNKLEIRYRVKALYVPGCSNQISMDTRPILVWMAIFLFNPDVLTYC